MKISHRIILVNLLTVAIVLVSAAIAFYSILNNTLTSQQSKELVKSSKNFVFTYRSYVDDIDKEFLSLTDKTPQLLFERKILVADLNDFFLEARADDKSKIIRYSSKNFIQIPDTNFTIEEFLKLNPYVIINFGKISGNRICYFGKVINSEVLDDLAKRIGADIALIWDNFATEVSNPALNLPNTLLYNQAYNYLKNNNNAEEFEGTTESSDIIATVYQIQKFSGIGNDFSFLIFKSHTEANDLRITLRNIIILISVVGIFMALILSYLLTHKFRERIADLNLATSQVSAGNFNMHLEVKSDDEIGKLGSAFNLMLDQLEKNQRIKNEYADFITLINKNASYSEISNAALKKIINICGFLAGALYSVDDNTVKFVCSYGLNNGTSNSDRNEFYKIIIASKEPLEISSDSVLPAVQTGTFNLNISHLLMTPVIYNNEVIAILEFACFNKPSPETNDYLIKTQEQLAIGLTNAKTLVKLENFVDELKSLNDEYQKQNIQIKKQNESLIELSHQLHAKARELEIQKEKAEESTKLKSQFLASMSHELRTPLNSILGLTELILYKTQLSQKDKERLGVVLKSSKRLMTLINDILDLSKIEAGKMKIIEEDILLEEIIDEVSNIASPLASEKGLAFNVLKKCNTKIIIITDRGRVTQVLLNLIDNAIKFTQNGSVELSINITPEKLLMFSVSDTGIGISEENKKIIFEEFRQVDGAASKKYNGTGLGLAICKKIVLLLGGNISVFSNEREGSTFSFTIPINYSSQKIQNDFTPIIPVARKNIKHPLIVFDNDTEVKYTISQYLISKGYSIVSIDYTEENIISAFEQTQFVINLEMLLPINDGWGAIAKLKNISVVFISLIGETKVAFGLGSFNYFVKPFSLDRFYLALPKLQLLLKKQIQKLFAITDINSEINICLERDVSKKISIDVIENNNYAFNKILEGQPDIIVFDLLLTDVKNLKLFFNLKSNPKTKQIPLIISSAKEITETEKQYFSSFVKEVSLNEKENDNSFIERSNTKSHSIDDSITSLSFSNTDSNSDNNILMKSNIQNMGDVLIVDDDPDTLFTLNELVQSVGCKTYTAKSGIDCLKILEKVKPALILLDIMMPEMDGFQTLKNIRSNINNASIPIFAVTAKAMVGDREIILKHGFDDYLSKPVSSLVLSDKLNQFFSKY